MYFFYLCHQRYHLYQGGGSAMYSAPTVHRAISVCKCMHENIGQLAYMMTIQFRDMLLSQLLLSAFNQPPAKSEFT